MYDVTKDWQKATFQCEHTAFNKSCNCLPTKNRRNLQHICKSVQSKFRPSIPMISCRIARPFAGLRASRFTSVGPCRAVSEEFSLVLIPSCAVVFPAAIATANTVSESILRFPFSISITTTAGAFIFAIIITSTDKTPKPEAAAFRAET